MERIEKMYELVLEMKVGSDTRDLPKVRKANIEFCKLYEKEFGGQEYIPGTLIANFDRARNNYLNSFSENLPDGCYTSKEFLDEANDYLVQIQRELVVMER